jgi:hypothetical protein
MDPFQYGDPVSAITDKHVNIGLPAGWHVHRVHKEEEKI